MGAIIIQAVLSWVNPYHPVAPFFDALANPLHQARAAGDPASSAGSTSPRCSSSLLFQVVLMLPIAWLEYEIRLMLDRALL